MKHFKICLLLLVTLISAASVHAQTVDDIINKHLDAIGGKDKLGQINSVYIEATTQIMGNSSPVKSTILNGKGYKNETEFNGQKLVRCYTDKSGWAINPFAGGDAPQALADDEYKSVKDDIFIGGALFNYAANKAGKAEFLGTENGTFKIKITSADNVEATYYIDTATFFLVKMVRQGAMQGQQVEVAATFSDFKKTDGGMIMPYTTNIDFGGNFSLSTAIDKVETNKTIDPAIFEMPK
ncbi:MAG TPA: hypothetical protein PLA68_07590 [Panacibacter sp.]|nr:hypothetical protein [Panacibacter sp.]